MFANCEKFEKAPSCGLNSPVGPLNSNYFYKHTRLKFTYWISALNCNFHSVPHLCQYGLYFSSLLFLLSQDATHTKHTATKPNQT